MEWTSLTQSSREGGGGGGRGGGRPSCLSAMRKKKFFFLLFLFFFLFFFSSFLPILKENGRTPLLLRSLPSLRFISRIHLLLLLLVVCAGKIRKGGGGGLGPPGQCQKYSRCEKGEREREKERVYPNKEDRGSLVRGEIFLFSSFSFFPWEERKKKKGKGGEERRKRRHGPPSTLLPALSPFSLFLRF